MHWFSRVQLLTKALQKSHGVESRTVKWVLVVNNGLLVVHFGSEKAAERWQSGGARGGEKANDRVQMKAEGGEKKERAASEVSEEVEGASST